MYGRNLKAYQRTNVNAEISVADPYYVTKMLFQGAYERMAQAKGAIERGDLALKAKKLSSATAIIEYLRSTLDFSQSQSIAQSLYDLYSYIIDQLADASLGVIIQPIDNAIRTLMPIKKPGTRFLFQPSRKQAQNVLRSSGTSNLIMRRVWQAVMFSMEIK